jgi:hypothetical protein
VHSGQKHVEKRNKHTKKNCAPRWFYLKDYTAMQVNKTLKKVNEIKNTFKEKHSHPLGSIAM